MRTAAASAAFALVLGGACSSLRTVELDLTQETGIELVAMIGTNGELTRVTQPFGMRDGRVVFGEVPAFRLEDGESSVLLVRIAEHMLPRGAQIDLFETELEAAAGEPPMPPNIVTSTIAGLHTWSGALPDGAEIFDVTGNGEGKIAPSNPLGDEARAREARGHITLRMPIDLEHCRAPGDRELTRWGDLEPPNAPCPLVLQGVREAIADGGHLLLVSRASLAWIARGASVSTCPGDAAEYLPFGLMGAGVFAGAAIDRSVDPHRFVVAGNFDDRGGAIFDVELRGGGPVITSSIAVPDLTMFHVAASAAGDGRFAITAETRAEPIDGAVLFVERSGTRLSITERFRQERGTPRHDERRPVLSVPGGWLVLRASSLYRYADGVWTDSLIEVDQAGFYGITARELGSGELEVWVSSERGVLYHRAGDVGPWETFRLERTPSFLECTIEAPGGGRAFNRRVEDLEISGGRLFASIDQCRAVAQVALEERGYDETCVAFLPAVDQSEPFGAFRSMVRLAIGDGALISAAEDGKIRTARLIEP